jgi:hypothetical protein
MKKTNFSLPLALLLFLFCSCNGPRSSETVSTDAPDVEGNWDTLFNHNNLEGWEAMPGGKWEVRDGSILGTSPAEEPLHGILLSKKEYGDFKLKVIYKAIQGNSGVYFRVEKVDEPVNVYGFQAEIDPEKDAGGLYETGGRAWVVQPTPEDVKKWYKPDEWNEMVIEAVGKDVTVYLNGFKTAELKNDSGRTKGHIGLQLHGGMEMEVLFKEILIQEL